MESKSNLTKLGEKVAYSQQYDPSQLEAVNREERRKLFKYPMYGVDIWTAYEFSFLLPSGKPQFYVLRISNPASSVNIFESKSLKLYLNSFNNTVFESLESAIIAIKKDLSKISGGEIEIFLIDEFRSEKQTLQNNSTCIDWEKIETNIYDYDKTLLRVEQGDKEVEQNLYSNLLRSNCEITGQPDWATIWIEYLSNKSLDKGSLLKYIISYRNHREFHEPTCERIYQDLFEVLQPTELLVCCQYTRRGGIDINPMRANFKINSRYICELPKLLHQ
jgi:7-cyano-7-deazaguanine reductase